MGDYTDLTLLGGLGTLRGGRFADVYPFFCGYSRPALEADGKQIDAPRLTRSAKNLEVFASRLSAFPVVAGSIWFLGLPNRLGFFGFPGLVGLGRFYGGLDCFGRLR